MNIKEAKQHCFDLLQKKLEPLGYMPNKKEQKFLKLRDDGVEGVFFNTVEYAALKQYDISFFITVRVNKVQELINLTQNFVDGQESKDATCIINIGMFTGNPELHFETARIEDIETAVEEFWTNFKKDGLGYIEKCYNIDFLNTIYPRYKDKSDYWFTAFNWFIAIPTVAYLANKDTFTSFREKYISYLINELNIPEGKLNKLNEYLNKISK